MGVTEAAKIKISKTVWAPVVNQDFFKFRIQVASEDSKMTSDQKMPRLWPPLKFDFEGVSYIPWVSNFEIEKSYFFAIYFFPESGVICS
jgi:hypothetical protein